MKAKELLIQKDNIIKRYAIFVFILIMALGYSINLNFHKFEQNADLTKQVKTLQDPDIVEQMYFEQCQKKLASQIKPPVKGVQRGRTGYILAHIARFSSSRNS